MDATTNLVLALVLGALGVAVLLAQLRLFGIDRTLRRILAELVAAREVDSARHYGGNLPAQPANDAAPARGPRHKTFTCVALLLTAPVVGAHGGGLDANGCHNDRQRGGYHCHRGALAGRSFASRADAERALVASVMVASGYAARR